MSNSRIDFIDISKAIGIILVVIGHTVNQFNDFIYQFHMPLFFFISGYLYNDKYTISLKALIKSRIKSLYFPFVIYGILFIFMHNIFLYLGLYDIGMVKYYSYLDIAKYVFKTFLFVLGNNEIFLNTFWFLISLFLLELLFSIISNLITKFKIKNYEFLRLFLILLLTLLGNSLLFDLNRYSVYRFNFGIPIIVMIFYYLGFLSKKYNLNFLRYKYLILFLFTAILFIYFSGYTNKVDLHLAIIDDTLYFYVFASIGLFAVILFSNILSKVQLFKKILQYIGKSTIMIMALHTLSFKILSLIIINLFVSSNYTEMNLITDFWLLFVAFGLVIPIAVNYIVNVIKLRFDYETKKAILFDRLFDYFKF